MGRRDSRQDVYTLERDPSDHTRTAGPFRPTTPTVYPSYRPRSDRPSPTVPELARLQWGRWTHGVPSPDRNNEWEGSEVEGTTPESRSTKDQQDSGPRTSTGSDLHPYPCGGARPKTSPRESDSHPQFTRRVNPRPQTGPRWRPNDSPGRH